MKKQQSGMILLTTILMLGVLSLLVLPLMHTVLLYFKVSNRMLDQHTIVYNLEKAARQLLASNMWLNNAACFNSSNDPNQVISTMHQNKTCVISDETDRYYYFVNDLGTYPCLLIVKDADYHSSAHLLLTIATTKPPYSFLQLRVAQSIQVMSCKQAYRLTIPEGIISWRYT